MGCFLWPFQMIWGLLTGLRNMAGRLVCALIGIVVMIVGIALCFTIVGMIVGIPLALLGFGMLMRALF